MRESPHMKDVVQVCLFIWSATFFHQNGYTMTKIETEVMLQSSLDTQGPRLSYRDQSLDVGTFLSKEYLYRKALLTIVFSKATRS